MLKTTPSLKSADNPNTLYHKKKNKTTRIRQQHYDTQISSKLLQEPTLSLCQVADSHQLPWQSTQCLVNLFKINDKGKLSEILFIFRETLERS